MRLAVSALGDGPADVLWAHGLTSSRAQDDDIGLFPWDLGPLARVVRYDVRGHGESSGTSDPGDYTWPALAEDTLALADGLGLDTFVAAGSSLGAALALHVAVAAPERVTALALLVPPAAWSERPRQAEVYEKMAAILERKGAAGFADLVRGRPPYPFLDAAMPDIPDIVNGHVRRWHAPSIAAALRGAAASDLPPHGALADVDAPTLVLTWTGDEAHPESTARELERTLRRVTVRVAADVAVVRRWREDVREFVAGVAP